MPPLTSNAAKALPEFRHQPCQEPQAGSSTQLRLTGPRFLVSNAGLLLSHLWTQDLHGICCGRETRSWKRKGCLGTKWKSRPSVTTQTSEIGKAQSQSLGQRRDDADVESLVFGADICRLAGRSTADHHNVYRIHLLACLLVCLLQSCAWYQRQHSFALLLHYLAEAFPGPILGSIMHSTEMSAVHCAHAEAKCSVDSTEYCTSRHKKHVALHHHSGNSNRTCKLTPCHHFRSILSMRRFYSKVCTFGVHTAYIQTCAFASKRNEQCSTTWLAAPVHVHASHPNSNVNVCQPGSQLIITSENLQ